MKKVKNLFLSCTMAFSIQDTIGAATFDLIERVSEKAKIEKCTSIFMRINTPGGSLQSTRLITEHILASPVPFLCLISPAGGHAGSAGAIILQACHVSGGLTATNLGAATPVSGSGQEIAPDMRNKLINDTVSWLEAMTDLRGRNQDFSKKIITEGKAVTTDEAVKMKALDLSVTTELEFLEKSAGRVYRDQEKVEHKVVVGQLQEMAQDLRYQVLQWISEPEWAYLFFMGSLLLLYAEFSNPGLFVPGVAGAILLILSLIAFHKLEASFGGQALLFLGLLFWIAEFFVASKGILGIAGTLSFLIGSLLLFDVDKVGYDIPYSVIIPTVLMFGGLSLGLSYMAAGSLGKKNHDWDEQFLNSQLELKELSLDKKSGKIQVSGEIWNFESLESIDDVQNFKVQKRKNLTLILKKKNT